MGKRSNHDLVADPQIRAVFAKEVEEVNKGLASFEKIVAWELLPDDFTIETGEITPTLKVKRRVVNQKYGPIIDRLYGEADARQG
jgi:long-chain acyl-CoA synthetase